MAVPNPQQYKGMKGSAPIVQQGQTAGSYGNEPNMKDRANGPTPLKP